MPVSSPSYFPPQRSTDRIVGLNAGTTQTGNNVFLAGQDAGLDSTSSGLIIIGHLAGSGKITGQDNAVIIGVGAAESLYGSHNIAPNDAPVLIGYNCAQNTASADGSVIIGSNNFGQLEASTGANPFGHTQNVIIGSEILSGTNVIANPQSTIVTSVILGNNIYNNLTYWDGISECVLIGFGIGSSASPNSGTASSVIIGYEACADGVPGYGIVIGASAGGVNVKNSQYLTAIGINSAPNVDNGVGCIFLGQNAGVNFTDISQLVVINPGGVNGTYPADGVFAAVMSPQNSGGANVAIGGFTGSNHDLKLAGAVNIVKLFNGVIGTKNPTGGGYFYVDAGALHWVGSSGTDTLIAPA